MFYRIEKSINFKLNNPKSMCNKNSSRNRLTLLELLNSCRNNVYSKKKKKRKFFRMFVLVLNFLS